MARCEKYLVFVYGTLKRGEPNYHVMSEGQEGASAQLVGPASTIERYPLVIASRYNIPFLLDRAGIGHVRARDTHTRTHRPLPAKCTK
jgi:gamma-glutamylaminecyclotransferase